MVETSDERLDVEDVTEHALLDEPADREEVGVPPPALVHGDGALVLPRGGDDEVRIVAPQAHRLLDDDVLPGTQQLEREPRMELRRCRDDDDVDGLIRSERCRRVVRVQVGEVDARGLRAVGRTVGRRHEAQSVRLGTGEPMHVTHPAEGAVADDADPQRAGLRSELRPQQTSDEPAERRMRLQRIEVGDTARHDAARTERAHRHRRNVLEADAGRRDDGGVGRRWPRRCAAGWRLGPRGPAGPPRADRRA
jgi:hypothetical protein